MGHLFCRCACGPGIPGEFEIRREGEASQAFPSSPSRPSRRAGKEVLSPRRQDRVKTRSDRIFLAGALRGSSLLQQLGNDQIEQLVEYGNVLAA
ncbi:unnamed protein product [Effrenium voratum]|nr:unnamed protein product [Effrenium voratum]